MRIVVTGGAGFIGSHCVELLAAGGHDLLVLDDLSSGSLDNLARAGSRVRFTRLDVRDAAALGTSFAAFRPHAVLHLAAIASVVRSVEDPAATFAVNLGGTLHALEAARVAGARRFVFASSAAVYGLEPALPSHESDPLRPVSPYAAHKAAGELLCASYRAAFGLETVPLRFFNVFGARQRPDSPYSGVISLFVEALASGGSATILGDGEQTRDFIAVGDVAAAVAAALCGPDPGGDPINLGRGESLSVRRLYSLIAQALGAADAPAFGPERAGDVRHSRAAIEALRHRLCVTPVVPVHEAIAELARHRRARPCSQSGLHAE
ncbi:MAG TPA: NAD-dependent epimerase/dehydratase family protein [Dehalococcoidia bacterium]|nr:NAD-dependent epimerase/dehydratase family protein [Dehalococcoidia bacterium]